MPRVVGTPEFDFDTCCGPQPRVSRYLGTPASGHDTRLVSLPRLAKLWVPQVFA